MDMNNALQKFDALSHEMRLKIIKFLVPYGNKGSVVKSIAEFFQLPHNSVSTHLQKLKISGLVESTRDGKFVYYMVNFSALNTLIEYLLENCCTKESSSCIELPILKQQQNKR
jgi:ArsR family transcriptional regulator, arsenate/arsenite/antimonite-responsive transcriptional repressor